ncbi:MAG: putative toxin-antitoxin system toxin component, PIN family [Burkholderiales bacterium]|nr:putative toxin-antitoxin system toxin component, PIN family [Burkholderiales bacterium]
MTSPLRVVLDTNVVLSALVFGGGQAGQLRRAWQAGAFVPLVSAVTVQELVRVLAYPKFALARAEQDELLADFLPYAQTVRMPQPPPPVPDCRDPLDVPFLQLAVAGQAQRLVSGDKDLLAVAQAFHQATGCRITTLSALLSEIAAGKVAPGG